MNKKKKKKKRPIISKNGSTNTVRDNKKCTIKTRKKNTSE
jgi:hypothetical protein